MTYENKQFFFDPIIPGKYKLEVILTDLEGETSSYDLKLEFKAPKVESNFKGVDMAERDK